VDGEPLAGQVAIVSGAAGGLGVAWSRALRAAGATVVGFDLVAGTDLVADAADPDDVRRVVDRTVAEHGRIDIAIANAGRVRLTSPFDPWDKALADFDDQIRTNLLSVFLLGRAVMPVMVEGGGGHIVNISTDHYHRAPGVQRGGGAKMDVYDASKYGVFGLTGAWAAALRPHGIRVNELCMGATDGPMLRAFLGERATPELTATWLQADDLAGVLVDLLCEGPAGRTGTQIGLWIGHPVVLPP
jgi:NAD(P)-dependent dehydrogenase (short-subunit alcohol dehydrogenase family)